MKDFTSCEEFRAWVLQQVDPRGLSDDEDDDLDPMDCFEGEPSMLGWAERGRYRAITIIKETTPFPDETVTIYAKRIETSLHALKDEFCQDVDDEDGFGAGAVMDFIETVKTFF